MARRMRSISVSRTRGVTLFELLVVMFIASIIVASYAPEIIDVRFGAVEAAQKANDGSMMARISAASRQNFVRGEAAVTGTRMGKWEYSCNAGNQIAQLLDDKTFVGGSGGMWFKNPDGTPDYSRYWALGGQETVTHGELVACTATRDGKTEVFMLTGCTTWEGCRCNDYPSDCETF